MVCIAGGTGTGKSTIFNSLAGYPLSRVGVRRPCTMNAVALIHEDFAGRLASYFGFAEASSEESAEETGDVRIHRHKDASRAGVALIDTPDFDSAEVRNREVAEDFFVVCDVLVLVTSQEKYGDLSGRTMLHSAISWGKRTVIVLNKVSSDAAFNDFTHQMLSLDPPAPGHPVRVDKYDPSPEKIAGLWDEAFSELKAIAENADERADLQRTELLRLRTQSLEQARTVAKEAEHGLTRVEMVTEEIVRLTESAKNGLDHELDSIMSKDVESRVQERLRSLLRKYDVFFHPRRAIRTAVGKAIGFVGRLLPFTGGKVTFGSFPEEQARKEDIRETMSHIRLQPLETAISQLNLSIAGYLAHDPALDDFRRVAQEDVERWSPSDIAARFDEAFPGVEKLLEQEFERFKSGLSTGDEIKLYSAYTFWALLVITAESVMWGGFTLFDALLSSVILPLIPKWLLSLKVTDLLREIARRVEDRYRHTLHEIVDEQSRQYCDRFRALYPDEQSLDRLHAFIKATEQDLSNNV